MKKRLFVFSLLFVFVFGGLLTTAACTRPVAEQDSITILSEKNPTLFSDTEYTLEFEYTGYAPSVHMGSKKIADYVSLNEANTKIRITPKNEEGDYVITFKNGETVKETVTIQYINKFPKDPKFNPLGGRTQDYTNWTEFGAHDPSFIEDDGTYYAFSTDVNGTQSGYQIRKSSDLLHWAYDRTAIAKDDMNPVDYVAGDGEFQEAYDWCVTAPGSVSGDLVTSTDGTFSFWAPDVIKGNDGKYWLYFSLTGYFGGSKSYIGLAKADTVTGPYKFDSEIVKSPAGGATPNAIDASVFFEEGDRDGQMWMTYGSFFRGIHVIKLDRATGRRVDAPEYTGTYEDGNDPYYGKRIAGQGGNMEGPVITYRTVQELDEETGAYQEKGYYYLFTSYGDLTSTYHMRSVRSENPDGPYVDVTGQEMRASTANNWANSTGNKVMGWFQWQDYAVDFNAPGHNDLQTLSNGTNLVIYHCRTYYWDTVTPGSGNNFHYLYLAQYAFNEDGQIVMNPNRYAGERLRKIEEEEVTSLNYGAYKFLTFDQATGKKVSVQVTLASDGSIAGLPDSATGSWELKGDNYLNITIGQEVFKGVIMPAWLQEEGKAGYTITALSTETGMALYMNSDLSAAD